MSYQHCPLQKLGKLGSVAGSVNDHVAPASVDFASPNKLDVLMLFMATYKTLGLLGAIAISCRPRFAVGRLFPITPFPVSFENVTPPSVDLKTPGFDPVCPSDA
jgi:hypothetical protein